MSFFSVLKNLVWPVTAIPTDNYTETQARANLQAINSNSQAIATEIIAAAGSMPSVPDRLDVSLAPDGKLKATAPTAGFYTVESLAVTFIDNCHFSVPGDLTARYLHRLPILITYSNATQTDQTVHSSAFANGVTTVKFGKMLTLPAGVTATGLSFFTARLGCDPAIGEFTSLEAASTVNLTDIIPLDQLSTKRTATVAQVISTKQDHNANLDVYAANPLASVQVAIDAASPNKDIAALPVVTTAAGIDMVSILQGGIHKKISYLNLANSVPPAVELRTTDYSAILANLGKEWFRSDIGGKYMIDLVPTGAWVAGPNTIAQRFASGGGGSKTKTLVAGGRGPLASMEKSDSVAWSSAGNLGTARSDTQLAGDSDGAFIGPGYTNGTPYFGTDLWDGVTRSAGPTWPDALWSYAMNGKSKSACATFAGVNGNSGATTRCTKFDGVATSTISAYPFPANGAAGGIGDITACATFAGSNAGTDMGTIYKFDNVAFSLICNLLSSRTMSASSGLGVLSDAVIAGGTSAGANQKFSYKLVGNTITALPDIPIAVHWPSAAGGGASSAVSIGGQNGGFSVNYLTIPSCIQRKILTTP